LKYGRGPEGIRKESGRNLEGILKFFEVRKGPGRNLEGILKFLGAHKDPGRNFWKEF